MALTTIYQEEEYWGQASIVLRAERIHIRILELARENDMEVLIQDANQKKIIGNEAVLLKEPRSFSNNLFNDWEIYAIPEGGWTSNSSTKILILLSGLIVATLLSAVIYFVLHSTYRLKYNMSHDQLTDLYNRHYLDGIQKKIVADSNENKSSFGLMHIDLDDFKSVNDLHGHEKGDYVLSEMAKILKTISRSEDLIFRIGGDEFLIIAVQIRSREELEKMRLRYYEEMESMSHFDKYLSMTRPSIGIALYNKDGYNFDQVMKVADLNMYEEKARNKKEKAER